MALQVLLELHVLLALGATGATSLEHIEKFSVCSKPYFYVGK